MPSRQNLRLSFDAQLKMVPIVRRRVGAFLREHAVLERVVDEFLLALDELCNNAIEHGRPAEAANAKDELPKCILSLHADQERSEVVATLRSPGHLDSAELDAMMRATGLPDLESERGRGLFLFRVMVDAFRVTNTADNMLEVRFKKRW